MARNYNLQDEWDKVQMYGDYDAISEEEWQDYIAFTQLPEHKFSFTFKDRGCLMRMANQAGQYRKPADKDILWGLSLVNKIDHLQSLAHANEEAENALENDKLRLRTQHVTFRVAWHDNRWNGTVCNNPSKNRYCSGYHSMLSERLRKRKEQNLENEIKFKGQPINEYVPPCFWSINIFGDNDIVVKHDNPAEKQLKLIEETLPSHSMFSWPFAVSFSRTSEQMKSDGAYPKNLENVRIPRFRSKIKPNQSVAFMYAKFSNPLTEEEQQYLVVGCALVTEKGEPQYFGPKEVIEAKRESRAKYRNFPSMNWALRFSFENDDLRVRMPYHEYIEYAEKTGLDAEKKDYYLNRIKVAITEPELEHCFKYVAMDINDDEAIFILSKMRKQLIDCKDDGIVPPDEMQLRIDAIEELLGYCWKKRSYFPGFSSISRELLNWDKPEFLLDELMEDLQQSEMDDYAEKFVEIIENPNADKNYKKYASLLHDLREAYEDSFGLSTEQFLQLCMLNLKPYQFKRILKGKLIVSDDWRRDIDNERHSHELPDICNNPYLLFEDYVSWDGLLDSVNGEELDSPIDLFKIDIAYFPDNKFGINRIDLQRSMRNNDKRRLRALTIRYLRTLVNSGNCFADAKELEEAIKEYPLFYNMGTEYQIPSSFFERINAEYKQHFQDNDKVIVIEENETKYFYLAEVYQAEQKIQHIIEKLLVGEQLQATYLGFDSYLNKSIKKLKDKIGDKFDVQLFKDERTSLYENIYSNKLFVLAGNPGSGKSYELLNILTDWQNSGQKNLLLTPTGKAALRLKTDPDFPGIEASTIDKFLTDVKNGKISRATINQYNNVVIDEMSMVDLLKFRNLLEVINIDVPAFKRFVLVGDPHQLPAIGYGKVLQDILYFLKTHTQYQKNAIELQSNCRQELAESKILEFSEGYITDGELSQELKETIFSGATDISKGFRVHFWNTEAELEKLINDEFELLTKKYKGSREEKLNLLFKLDKDGSIGEKSMDLEQFQILSPYRSDFFGTMQINDFIQSEFKKETELSLMDDMYKQSDKIIRTKNYYDKGKLILSNGSIGLIRYNDEQLLYFPEVNEPISIYGEDGIRKNERELFELAYAITVHKAQGSGFNHLFFVLPKKPGLLSKELVYTALTRSRESVSIFIQGDIQEGFDKSVLEKARIRSSTENRKTTLMLDKPYRFYALEVDGKFIQSGVELLIYQTLKEYKKQMGSSEFSFEYELRPEIEGQTLPMKTDFTIITPKGLWYWEHLGRIGNKSYEWTWHNVKRKSYQEYGIEDKLITTHQLNGINPDKIKTIIEHIINDNVATEDNTNKYSKHHYSLR